MTKVTAYDQLVPAPKDGQPGAPAVSYYLTSERTSIVLNENNKPTGDSFIVHGWRRVGKNEAREVRNYVERRLIPIDDWDGGSLPYSVNLEGLQEYFDRGITSIEFTMYDEDNVEVFSLSIPIIRNGKTGPQGPRGFSGPLSYMAGEWRNNITFTRTEEITPIVSHNDAYWTPKAVGSNMGEEPSATSAFWRLVTKEDIILAKIIMAEFGKLAAAIFSGSYMFSQYGKVYGRDVNESSADKDSAYLKFDAKDPSNMTKFVPNLFINFLTGFLHCSNAEIEGIVNASSGVIGNWAFRGGYMGNGEMKTDANGNKYIDTELDGMGLSNNQIIFTNKRDNRQAILGCTADLGNSYMQLLKDNEATTTTKRGTVYNIKGSSYGQNFAFVGDGVGTLNGFIEGFSFKTITLASNSPMYETLGALEILSCNKFYIRCWQRGSTIMLPQLWQMQTSLGIDTNTPFSFKISYFSEIGCQQWFIYGRNNLTKTGTSEKPWSTSKYPVLISNNAQYLERSEQNEGDVLTVELCFNPTNYSSLNGFTCQYTARIVSLSI